MQVCPYTLVLPLQLSCGGIQGRQSEHVDKNMHLPLKNSPNRRHHRLSYAETVRGLGQTWTMNNPEVQLCTTLFKKATTQFQISLNS